MFSLENAVAAIMLLALIVYALMAGADFGGGVWDLFARGPRAQAQRELIANTIGPVWEANHVWLIIVVVLLFTGFPAAFAAIMTALNIPLSLMLLGIVLRGCAFAFRSYDLKTYQRQRQWSRLFAISSIYTPVMLGICIGALASGRIRLVNGLPEGGFLVPWVQPFPFAVGALTLALFAFLAAVYLAVEAQDQELREDFRLRALIAAVLVGALAWVCFFLARTEAATIWAGLATRSWSLLFHIATGAAATTAILALYFRRHYLARTAAVLQAGLILIGWGVSQYPFLVGPDITVAQAAAPRITLILLLIALGAGSLLFVPSLYFLLRIFKGPNAFAIVESGLEARASPRHGGEQPPAST
ncbi:MAG: cytochrome d ubiquinol oxidase subunit II [Planctomycetota bacterium]